MVRRDLEPTEGGIRTMSTMRAVVAERVGEPSEVLQLQARPIPEPGPGQVRIRVTAVPVEASDLHTIRGRYGFTPEFPAVPMPSGSCPSPRV
jgi:NADPH2:quinone reductase